jgi:hypothetical protein
MWHLSQREQPPRWAYSHLAHALVEIGIGREGGDLTGGQLQHADFPLLDRYLRFDDVDLLLGLDCLGLDLLDQLIVGG